MLYVQQTVSDKIMNFKNLRKRILRNTMVKQFKVLNKKEINYLHKSMLLGLSNLVLQTFVGRSTLSFYTWSKSGRVLFPEKGPSTPIGQKTGWPQRRRSGPRG